MIAVIPALRKAVMMIVMMMKADMPSRAVKLEPDSAA